MGSIDGLDVVVKTKSPASAGDRLTRNTDVHFVEVLWNCRVTCLTGNHHVLVSISASNLGIPGSSLEGGDYN